MSPAFLPCRSPEERVRNVAVLNAVDKGIANVTAELDAQGMYEDTLIVLFSDNGGDCESGAGEVRFLTEILVLGDFRRFADEIWRV